MKLIVLQGLDIPETEITIRCSMMDQRLNSLLEYIREHSFTLKASSMSRQMVCSHTSLTEH